MSLQSLREQVYEANMELVRAGLVIDTFGNASGMCRKCGLVVIKPSGVPYDKLTPADLVVSDIEGKIVEGELRPSSDLPTHLALYKAFPRIGGVAHTHSTYATSWAQACREIPCLGTTHADYWHGPIPVTKSLTPEEIADNYEWNTGAAITRRFRDLDPMEIPSVLVAGHAPFCWGTTPAKAAHTATILEQAARMSYYTVTLNAGISTLDTAVHDKHFLRKHGSQAYYGQK